MEVQVKTKVKQEVVMEAGTSTHLSILDLGYKDIITKPTRPSPNH